MKALSEYIAFSKRLSRPYFDTTLEEFCDKNNIDIDNISEDQLNIFYCCKKEYSHTANAKEKFFERIDETLMSHSGQTLAKRLQKIVVDHANVMCWDNNHPHTIELILNDDYLIDNNSFKDFTLSDNKLTDKIYDELKFFNYYITRISKNYGDKVIIEIEPLYSENLTKSIRAKTNVLYHVVLNSDLQSILKTGLRPRVGKLARFGGYRYFPEKLFLIAGSDNILNDIREIVTSKGYTNKNYAVIKIDISKHNIGLYRDDQYDSDNIVYTFEAIPPSLISPVDIDEL